MNSTTSRHDPPLSATGPARRCRFCDRTLQHTFADLGVSPLCESYLTPEQLDQEERFYPLCAYICEECLLVQVPEYKSPEDIFGDYAYFSSYSESWLEHAKRYARMAIGRFRLDESSLVVELASNDGYLLQHFVAEGIPVLGIDPAANIAEVARAKGIPTLTRFFGTDLAGELVSQGRQADLIAANNVLAHTPYLNDFVAGVKQLLGPQGTATFEFPHLLALIRGNQFDTIYHEHFSYFSFLTAERIFLTHGLRVYDVEELPTHGGSLRVYVGHDDEPSLAASPCVGALRRKESDAGLDVLQTYLDFGERVVRTKHRLLEVLLELKAGGKSIAGYGAPGKGNTLLNYCGIRGDFLDYTVDRNPYKQGLFLPGTRLPIFHPDKIRETRPDYVLILPWNLREEIVGQLGFIRDWGGRFIVPIPEAEVIS